VEASAGLRLHIRVRDNSRALTPAAPDGGLPVQDRGSWVTEPPEISKLQTAASPQRSSKPGGGRGRQQVCIIAN